MTAEVTKDHAMTPEEVKADAAHALLRDLAENQGAAARESLEQTGEYITTAYLVIPGPDGKYGVDMLALLFNDARSKAAMKFMVRSRAREKGAVGMVFISDMWLGKCAPEERDSRPGSIEKWADRQECLGIYLCRPNVPVQFTGHIYQRRGRKDGMRIEWLETESYGEGENIVAKCDFNPWAVPGHAN